MKKYLIFILMLLPMALVACGDDKDEPKTNTTKDPEGTVIVNISQGGSASAAGVTIELDKSYNLSSYHIGYISIVGPVKSIAAITATTTSVKNLTWSGSAAAEVGYGYILKSYDDYYIDGKMVYSYYAVYVDSEIASTSGGVLGYKLKVRKLLENVPETN